MISAVYRAIFYEGEKKSLGQIRIENRVLKFTSMTDQGLKLEWDEFVITAAREGPHIGVHSVLNPGQSIYVEGAGFETELAALMDVKTQSSMGHWWTNRPLRLALALSLGAIVLILAVLMLLRTQSGHMAGWVSPELETEWGESAREDYLKRTVMLPASVQKEWDELTGKILGLPALHGRKWTVDVVDEEDVNAFALPGGFVIFNAGLIHEAETPEEILGVLAHEAAHVTQRHGVKTLLGEASAGIALSLLFGGTGTSVIGMADRIGSFEFSRAQETEADRLALGYLKEANVSTDGLLRFFSRKDDDGKNLSAMKWLSTHPMDEERQALVKRNAFKAPPVKFNLVGLQAALKDASPTKEDEVEADEEE